MQLTAIHHIAIIVSDYNRSKDFYVNKLGFSVILGELSAGKKDWKSGFAMWKYRTGNLRYVQSPARVSHRKRRRCEKR